MRQAFCVYCSASVLVGCLASCAALPPPAAAPPEPEHDRSQLSYGLVKKLLVVGKTTQADVLRAFGAPGNMTFASGGSELWIYDQVRSESTSSATASQQGGGLVVGAVGGNAFGGAGIGTSSARTTTSQTSSVRTLTVIVEFDRSGVLLSHSARVGGY